MRLIDHGRGLCVEDAPGFRGWLEAHKAMASDMRLVDATYIAADAWVIARFTAVGTQDGPMGPFPASDRPFSLSVCKLWRLDADGRAVEGHNFSDGLGLLRQLGHLTMGGKTAVRKPSPPNSHLPARSLATLFRRGRGRVPPGREP